MAGFLGGKLGNMAAKVRKTFGGGDEDPADSLLPEQEEDEALFHTGNETLDGLQGAVGLAGPSSGAMAIGMASNLLPGGGFVDAFCQGVSAQQKGDAALEKLLKYPSVRECILQQTGTEPTLENLKAMIEVYNTQLADGLHGSGQNMESGLLSGTGGLLGGMGLAELVPGGALVTGAAAIAGGLGGSALMDYVSGIRNNDTNIPAMLEVVTHYESKGGARDKTYYSLLTALSRLSEDQQKEIESKLSTVLKDDMTLEQALITRIKGEQILRKGGEPPPEYYAIEQVMLSNGMKDPHMDVDSILRMGTGELAGRGDALAGDSKQHFYSLPELYEHYNLSAAEMITCCPITIVRQRRNQELYAQNASVDSVTVPRTPNMPRTMDPNLPEYSSRT